MPQSVFGAAAAVSMLNRAFNNASPANAVFNNQVQTAGTTEASQFAFARQFAASFDSLTNAQFAERVMGNMGLLPNDALKSAFTDYLGANAKADRGVIVLQLGQILANLENATGDQAVYAPIAAAWNKEVEQSFVYSSNTANTAPYNGDFAPVPVDQGQTFTLTSSIDNVVGTAGNDIIIGGSGAAGSASTLGSADVINGGAGIDTLKVTTEGAGAVSVTPNLTSVEKVFVQALNTGAATTLNLVNATGVQEIWNERSTQALTVTNVQELAAVGVKGDIGANAYLVGFKDSLASGVADSVTIALDSAVSTGNVGVGGVTAANEFETINISATGTNSLAALTRSDAAALTQTKTVNVTGAGKVTVTGALSATVTTIDASANTGGVSFAVNAASGAQTLKGGSGNDTFRLGATLTTADVVTGGDGTDILGVTTGASLVTGLQVTGFETLDIGGGNAAGAAVLANTYDLSKLAGITTLKVGSAINADAGTNDVTTINNLAKGAGVEINAALGTGAGDQLVVNVKDAGAGSPNDVIGVTVSGAAGVTTGGDLVIADIETVNLTASTTATTPITHTISALNVNQALTVAVLDGNAALTITDLNSTSLVLFDATAATKAVSVTTAGGTAFTATNGVAFKAGAAADTLDLTGSIAAGVVTGSKFYVTGNGGGDTITLTNAAADNTVVATNGSNGIQETVVYLAASDSQAGTTAAGVNKFDTINNFDAETALTTTQDFIDLKALGFSGTQAAAFTKTVGTAITATGGVAAADATSFFVNAGQKAAVAVVTSGADVWLFVDADKDGNYAAASDMAIKLVGVVAADVTSTDFIFA